MSETHPVLGPFSRPQVVGSITSLDQLPASDSLSAACDIVEFRVDGMLEEDSATVLARMKEVAEVLPVLLTVRCQAEGGLADLTAQQRSAVVKKFLAPASYVDIEVASATSMSEIITAIKASDASLVLSAHDFSATPSPGKIRETFRAAAEAGADIAKVAVRHNSLADLHSCAHLMQDCFSTPVSLMGMGALAPVSRVLFAQLGSVLNYGFLGETSTAPGQWPAHLLKQAILSSESMV